jgi:hypothetical protein
VGTWEERIKLKGGKNIDVQWRFHMRTPELDKPSLPRDAPEEYATYFDQVSFADLLDGANKNKRCGQPRCGVATVKSDVFIDALKDRKTK